MRRSEGNSRRSHRCKKKANKQREQRVTSLVIGKSEHLGFSLDNLKRIMTRPDQTAGSEVMGASKLLNVLSSNDATLDPSLFSASAIVSTTNRIRARTASNAGARLRQNATKRESQTMRPT